MSEPQRATLLRASAALYGLAAAISFHDAILRPAPPGQLPGFMTSHGYDAHSSFRFIALIVVLPIVFAAVLTPVARLLARDDVKRWARATAVLACIGALWTVTLSRSPAWVILPPALAIGAAFALRHFSAGFRRTDTGLVLTALALFIALVDITSLGVDRCVILAVTLIVALRLAIVRLRPNRGLAAPFCFALAPLALIAESHFFSYDQRHLGWPALAIIVISPIALRLSIADSPRRQQFMRAALAWAIYPLACYAYLSASSAFTAQGKLPVHVFEDAQHIVPAAEMMRGELPYRDIIPMHGLIQDGLLDYLLMRRGAINVGQLMKARGTISALITVAKYALGVAITGVAEGGVLTFLLATAIGIGGGTFRVLPALITLAIIIAAVRIRRPRLFAYAAAGMVLTVMTSVDYGVYVAFALTIAMYRLPGDRLRALREAAVGGGIASAIVVVSLAVAGILVDFVRVTFGEITTLAPVYALDPFAAPPAIQSVHFIPDILITLFDRTAYLFLFWVGALIFFAVALTTRWRSISMRRRARIEAFVVLASFMVICSISYAERHRFYFDHAVPPLIIGTAMMVARARLRPIRVFAACITVAAIILAQPTSHLGIVAWLRHRRGPLDPILREIPDIPRARGAFFTSPDIEMIQAVNRYVSSRLAPDETFFDFTNRSLLYYLLDRDCPVRQIEVAYYEPEWLQRQVITALERNPRIRAALVPAANDGTVLDGVSNATRAPLVWQYLQEHFTPDFEEGPVVFWRRK